VADVQHGGGIAAASLGGIFQTEIEHVVALALFIPVVLALAESVSIQSISLALQVLHGKTPSWVVIFQKLHRELLVGLLLGGAAGLLVGLIGLAWQHHLKTGDLRVRRHCRRRGQCNRVGYDRAQPAASLQARSPFGRRPCGVGP